MTAPRTESPSGRWLLDPRTADVAFSGRASRLSPTVRARFTGVRGAVLCDTTGTRVEVDVDVRTMTAGNRAWDEVLATVDPFACHDHPTARYRGVAADWRDGAARVEGELALRGVVRPVTLRARHTSSRCGRRLAVQAEGEVDREAFGVRLDVPGAALFLPRRLQLVIRVDAVQDLATLVAA